MKLFIILIVLFLASACVTANPAYRDCSGVRQDKWTGLTHPDMY